MPGLVHHFRTMQVTCSCGKKLLFSDDPNEVQVCDRCGQTVRRTGPVADKPSPARRGSGLRGAVHGTGEEPPPPPRRPRGNPPITTREKLYIASARKSNKGLGCVVLLLVALAAAFAIDYFAVYPVRALPCGHVGKESYLFGLLPFGHSCEGLEAIRYMDRARQAFLDAPDMAADMDLIRNLAGLGEPPASYVITPYEDGSFTAMPKTEADPALAGYTMAPDGTVTREDAE